MASDPTNPEPPENAPAENPADDANQRDPMGPPEIPCECSCLHCGRTFMSNLIWFQRVIGDPTGFEGFWMCPTPNCSGAGFTFDIFPIDPSHPANEGWHYFEDEDEDPGSPEEGEPEEGEWDPTESKYKALDEEMEGEDDEDLEGEEWKHGLAPGERPEPEWVAEARKQEEERQKEFDQPDQRPREIQWREEDHPKPSSGPFNEDDIPF